MDNGMKDILLTKLQNPDLDVALFHAHGDVDMQFIVGDEPAATVDQHVEAIKRFIREKLRSAKRHKQSVAEALTYYTNQYHLPKTWFTDVFSDSLTAADSLADFKQDIHSEDIDRIAPQAKFVMFDECFNGSFHKENYIAGKYVFGNGKTVVAVANAVNVLQDLWANEQIGVLGYGVRVGSWHKFRNTIESHLIGDPTFHFTSTQTIDLQLLLSTKQHDASVWRKLLTHHDAAIRTLAVAMVSKIEGAAAEKEILNIFDTDPSMNVRLSALKSLAFLRSPAFEKALMKGIQDPYEFLRRISVRWMGEIGKEESIPALVNAAFNDPSERVQYNAHNALEQIGLGKAWPVIQSVDRSLPPSEIRKRIVETFERSVGRIRKDIDSESTPIILSDTASIKSRVSKLRTFRLYNYEEVIPVLIAAAENEHNPVRVRVAALETMGWYSFSYQRTTFLTSIDALLNQQKELTPAVQSEAVRTKNRLLTGANDPITP
jgi:hypothetical protein